MAIDPVCGMTVDEKSATATTVHVGKTWYFCSTHCQHEFEANPGQYAGDKDVSRDASPKHDHERHDHHGHADRLIFPS